MRTTMMKCNGCGGEFDRTWGIYSYGEDHERTLCRGCHRVLISILLNSDLSEHWDEQDLPEEWVEEHEKE